MSFRDSLIVVLDTSRTSIRAGLGLHDLLRTPSVEILARVGLPRNLLNASQDDKTNGDAQGSPSTSKAPTALKVKVTDYLVGSQLEEALAAGQDIVQYWPFAEADIGDWTQAEALWKHVLFNRLHLRRTQMESPVLLTLPPCLSRDAYERVCQLFFERFNVAAFGVLDRPTAQFYAAVTASSQLSGVVVDIEREWTDIMPICDGFLLAGARMSVRVGMEDCKKYLAELLKGNQSVMAAMTEPAEGHDAVTDEADQQTALEELALQLWEEGQVKVLSEGEAAAQDAEDSSADGDINIAAIVVAGKEKAVIEKGMKNKAARANAVEQARAREIEARDLVEVQWRGKTVTVGKERHRFCEPLFDVGVRESVKGKERERGVLVLSVQTAVGEAVARTEVDQRAYIWQGLFVTGEITNHIKGLGVALQTRLSSFLPGSIDPQQNEVQPRSIRTLKIPDYFGEYRDKGDGLASFLGASIVAKITFNDAAGKSFLSKGDYASMGPRTVLGMSPSLL